MKITWPEMRFAPVNLWTVCPAWYWYATAEERREFLYNILR